MKTKMTVKDMAEKVGITERAMYYRLKRWCKKRLKEPAHWPQTLGGVRKRGHQWENTEQVTAERWAEIRWTLEVVPSAAMVAEAFPDVTRGAIVDLANGRTDRIPGYDQAAVDAAYEALNKDLVRVTGL